MCSSHINPEAEKAMADLLRDMAEALDPDHPEEVQVGPVDFGPCSGLPKHARLGVHAPYLVGRMGRGL